LCHLNMSFAAYIVTPLFLQVQEIVKKSINGTLQGVSYTKEKVRSAVLYDTPEHFQPLPVR